MRLRKPFMAAKIIAKSIAHPKPAISKPGTINATNHTMKPIITKVKRPNVRILIGSVMSRSKGRMKELKRPKRTATTRAVPKELR